MLPNNEFPNDWVEVWNYTDTNMDYLYNKCNGPRLHVVSGGTSVEVNFVNEYSKM